MARKILSLIIVTILIMSSLAALFTVLVPATAQQQAAGSIPSGDRAARNWEYANHDSWSSNYSPQNEINKDNVQFLEVKWLFPHPTATSASRSFPLGASEGSIIPTLIVDGTVYHTTNVRNIYAFEGTTGKTQYTYFWEFNVTKNNADQAARGLAGVCTGGGASNHMIHYIDGLLYQGVTGGWVSAVDAKTGKEAYRFGNICADIEGDIYKWPGADGPGGCGGGNAPPVVYRKENILLLGVCGADNNPGGRPFVDGYDLKVTPPKRLWRTYMAPPAPEGDPEWAIKACNNARVGGWYFDYPLWYKDPTKMAVNCKDVPRENLINDWGVPKFWGNAPASFWGQWAVDEETGLFYLGTGNAGGGNGNATFWTPGPNLYAATTVALDAKTGQIVWWNQNTVRDMKESDNSWNVVLATIGGKKMIIKHGTQQFIWAYDAATGAPTWVWEPSITRTRTGSDGVVRGRSGCTPSIGANPATQDGLWNDVMSHFDMQEKKWFNYPSTGTFCWIPERPGESDIALDTSTNTIFVQIGLGTDSLGHKAARCDTRADTCGSLAAPTPLLSTNPQNVTVYAVDATTGKEKWSLFIPGASVRGGTIVSGGVVYVNSVTGYYYAIDAATGKVLHKIFIGGASFSQASIGKTSIGKSVLFLKSGGTAGLGPYLLGAASGAIPGALLVYGLPDKLPEPQVITKEVIKEVPKEVIREVPKEVIKEVTVETVSPISYAAIGISVIILVIAGVLFTRRKKA